MKQGGGEACGVVRVQRAAADHDPADLVARRDERGGDVLSCRVGQPAAYLGVVDVFDQVFHGQTEHRDAVETADGRLVPPCQFKADRVGRQPAEVGFITEAHEL